MSLYSPITPTATYSPWNEDKDFQDTYAAIRGYTLVDIYRCWELWHLVEQSAKLSEGCLLEVGVWRGGTGGLIAKKAELCKLEELVYLCDTFTGVVKAGAEDSSYVGGEHSDTTPELAKDLFFGKLKLTNIDLNIGSFPDEIGEAFEDKEFRFVHIDVDTYQSAKDVTDWVWPKLVSGASILYDDYGFEQCSGVTKFVNSQVLLPDRLFVHNLNGHGIIIKL